MSTYIPNTERQKLFYSMAKSRMEEIGLEFTDEQADQMGDFINGIVLLVEAIQRDCICQRIREMSKGE